MAEDQAQQAAGRRPKRLTRQPGGRPNAVKVLLSDAEHARITARAAQVGVSVPRLLVEAALADGEGRWTVSERHGLLAEFTGARALVGKVGTNVNQVAAKVNSGGGVTDAQLRATLDAATRALARLDEAVRRLEFW